MTNDHNRPIIPGRFIPRFCDKCGDLIRERQATDDWNQFVCRTNPLHSRWIQSPPVAYAVLLDEYEYTYVIQRKIPPAIGEWCLPGGYVDFGETARDTITHETLEEACISIVGRRTEYLGQWYERHPGVTVTAFLVRIASTDVAEFIPNKEATHRMRLHLPTMDPDILAFRGNRLALSAARKIVLDETPFEHT